jgi:hypothetical protein
MIQISPNNQSMAKLEVQRLARDVSPLERQQGPFLTDIMRQELPKTGYASKKGVLHIDMRE